MTSRAHGRVTKGAEHAKKAHAMTSIPPEMLPKVQAAIRDKQ
ncbi:MAG: DUF1059 domain-containing protein [Candidatus Rokuibacteriota bacterium]